MLNVNLKGERVLRVGMWIGVIGGGLGALLGASMAHADCRDKRNCAGTYGVDPPCPECEPSNQACGKRTTVVGLAFEVLVVPQHEGYGTHNYYSAGQDLCYVKYDCDLDLENSCTPLGTLWDCIQDEQPSITNWGFDNGIFANPCD